jgi:hypothetical protein
VFLAKFSRFDGLYSQLVKRLGTIFFWKYENAWFCWEMGIRKMFDFKTSNIFVACDQFIEILRCLNCSFLDLNMKKKGTVF